MSEMADKIRNIALLGHGGAGKTSLAEVMLFKAGVTNRHGRVEDGNTVMDYEPEELKRGTSINATLFQYDTGGYQFTLIDTPGDQNFFSATKTGMQAAGGAVLVIDAVNGVEVRTEMAADYAKEFNIPTMIFINKLDRERADFTRAMEDATAQLEIKPIAVQIPIGKEAEFNGVVDLIAQKAYTFNDGKKTGIDIPADMADEVESAREALIENVAEADDEILERYLEGESISDEELLATLKKGIVSLQFAPVLCGSATNNIGIDLLTDFMKHCMPSPVDIGGALATDPNGENEVKITPDPDAPFSAYVFKTVVDPYAGRLSIFKIVSGTLTENSSVYNVNKETKEKFTNLYSLAGKEQKQIAKAGPGSIVAVAKLKETETGDTLCDESKKVKFKVTEPLAPVISFAVHAKSKADEDKLFSSLTRSIEEDNALKLERNAETHQVLLSGMGLIHIEATLEKLQRKYNVGVAITTPKVAYKETIRKKVRVQGKHKKQSGGHGQYGDCWIVLEPQPRGEGFEFVDAIVGGVIPRQYIPAVQQGIKDASVKGVLAGFPCVDFKVTLDDGSFHAVDSSEMAFKIAGALAFKKAAAEASPVLLEPIMKVETVAPDEFMGDLMGDMNSRRGRVLGMDSSGKNQIISAHVPMAEILAYAPDLNSMTGGRGMFTMEFSHYDEVPAELTKKVIEQVQKENEAEK